MSDKQLTDKEIIRAFEKEIHLAEYVDSDYCSNVNLEIIKSALDLITRQQSRIDELVGNNDKLNIELQSMRGAANSLKMHYEEAQAEIERLNKENKNLLCKLCKKVNNESKAIEKLIKSESYKEFAERLKQFLCLNREGEVSVISFENINYIKKELAGENNAEI